MLSRNVAAANLRYVLSRVKSNLGDELGIKATRRDPKEPGRKEKETAEDQMIAVVQRHFHRQLEAIQARLESENPSRKATVTIPPWVQDDFFWEDPEFESDLLILLVQAVQKGITIFQATTSLVMDWTATNAEAAKWAREYAYDLIKGITDTTRKMVSEAITSFIETPGMTIGDTMELLQRAAYPETRAGMIATTEITRSYAQGNKMAGEALKKEWPDVAVVKHWFTNNDDRVCEICGPVDGEEVAIDEKFSNGFDNPPAHVNCRCWTSTRTRIGNG